MNYRNDRQSSGGMGGMNQGMQQGQAGMQGMNQGGMQGMNQGAMQGMNQGAMQGMNQGGMQQGQAGMQGMNQGGMQQGQAGMQGMQGMQGGFPPAGAGQTLLPDEQSYIENILRLNRGKLGTFYLTFDGNPKWPAKIFKGVIEAAGRDHIIISEPETGKRHLLLMVYLDYVSFDEKINYSYPYGGQSGQMSPSR